VDLLRRIWVIALAAVAGVGVVCAVMMRFELLTPGGTFSAETYNEVFSLHGLAMVGAMLGAFIAIPTRALTPTRHTLTLGTAAIIAWAVALVFLVTAQTDWLTPERSARLATAVLAFSSLAAIAQIATSLPRFTITWIASIVALAIVSISLIRGELPPRDHLLAACTLAVCTVRSAFVLLTAAWVATIILHAVDVSYVPHTVAALAPFPALGAAMFLAFAKRPPRWTTVFTVGAYATSASFLILGLRGMPARYWQYDPSFQTLQILVGVSFALTLAAAVRMLR